MMTQFGSCPRCQQKISEERLSDTIVVCNNCGYTEDKTNTETENQIEKRFVHSTIFFSALLIASFIHGTKWNSYSFEIIPLKAKQITGMASKADLNRIAEICLDRKSSTCTIKALAAVVQKDGSDLDALLNYGNTLIQYKDFNTALRVYGQYFRKGGTDLKAGYNYAKILGDNQQTEDSRKYFEYVLSAKPDKLQITVTQAYVNMLYKNGRLTDAKNVIEGFRKKGENASYFMESRLRDIKSHMASR